MKDGKFNYTFGSIVSIFCFCHVVTAKQIASYRISPFKIVPIGENGSHESCRTSSGLGGICMFQWECYLSGGTPVGICSHGFHFGACCSHDTVSNELESVNEESPTEVPKPGVEDVDPLDVECGVPPSIGQATGRIVNGTRTRIGEFPWQVSIMTFKGIKEGFQHRCGGVLIAPRWVVTAAHCTAKNLLVELQVRVGEHEFGHRNHKYPTQDLRVKRKILHPDFNRMNQNGPTYESDIALLELKTAIKKRPHVGFVCLPQSRSLLDGEMGEVSGWGKTSENGNRSDVLLKVSLPILSNSECEELYAEAGIPQAIPQKFLCAGYREGGKDACSGDSGGPLHTKDSKGRFILSGIVSWGNGCGEPLKPGVYTRVSHLTDWIRKEIKHR